MPFRTALSAPNQTTKRGGVFSAIRCVAALTPTVQFQCNPSVAANGKPAASVTFSTTLSGSINNLLIGMTVFLTPSSDWKSDLKNRPEDCLRTYIRKAPTSTIIYIGLTAFQWGTGHYLTAIDNFEVHQKKTRIIGTTIYKDVDLTYRAPLPRITGLYATLVMTHTPNADVSPTPTEEAMTAGASISSRTWATIENGVVTKAVSTSATPTFNLDLGIHWLHETVTDSGGRTNWFAMLVVVAPYDHASVITKLVAGTVTNDLNTGIGADISTVADMSTLVPGAAALIFDDLTYRDGSIEQVVKAFGWLDGNVSQEIGADEQYGIRTTYSTSLVGIRDAAQTVRLPAFPFKHKASPTVWGQVTRCTVYDAIWYAIAEHSTIANIAALDFPSGYTDYQYNPAIQIPEGTLFDSVDTLAFFASGGMLNYSPNGELYFRQSLLYETSASDRNTATVYATYTTGDGMATRIERPPVNKFPLSAIQGGFATFNTTTNKPRIYQSIAPQENTPAALLESVDGIIMTKNLSDANAGIEAGKLSVNHFFASTQPTTIAGQFLAGYTALEASCFQWHKFSIDSTETLDGSSFDSDTRHLCTQVSSNFSADEWALTVDAEFREETDGGDNYARETEFVPLGTNAPYPTYPMSPFSPYLGDFDTPTDYYGDEYEDQREGWEDPTLPPETAAENQNPQTGVLWTLYVPFRGGAISTPANSALGVDYLIRITGEARITPNANEINTNANVDATTDAFAGGGATGVDVTVGQSVTFVATGLWAVFGAPVFTADGDGTFQALAQLPSAPMASLIGKVGVSGDWFFIGASNTVVMPATGELYLVCNDINAYGDNSGSQSVDIDAPATTSTHGDAFYTFNDDDTEAEAYSGSDGLNQDGAGIVQDNAYNPTHVYEYTTSGTGNVFTFGYVDPDGNWSDNENKVLKVEVIPLS